GRVHHGCRVVPVVGAAHGPRAALHVLGRGGYGAADHLLASAQYRALAARDRESVPDAERGSRVTRIAVAGGGAWRTGLADRVARKGDFDTVTLWAREPEVVESVNREHVNHMFLPGAALAPAVAAVGDLTAAVRGAEVVVSAAGSHAVRAVVTGATSEVGSGALGA